MRRHDCGRRLRRRPLQDGWRESYCKACDRRRGLAYYAEHRDQLYADRKAAREAAWQADLKELEKESRKRVAAQKKLHEAGVRRQESSYARSAYPI